ncbi:MAG: hypothetical protein KDJ22_04515 [Candidatus Competibacteraceae bacterium]|nr:hypothetical protein [Candidatus Competibacteraceae bacterium]MCB1769943.1 hypothetical protein [Candidatus Competibacteraceae bacterium]MCB1820131.1 hypothetical protein [Candidatus Competibacteraceae bacterium]
MSGPKCYRYTVDSARLQQQREAERQRQAREDCQQAIARTRADWATLPQILADLQHRYPAESWAIDLVPPAPPVDDTLDVLRSYRDRLNQQLLQARADLQRLSERAAANHTAKTLLAELSQDAATPLRTAAEVLHVHADLLPTTDRPAEWQRLFSRLNDEDQGHPPPTLLALRDAFLVAASAAQADALATEVRQHIQQLNQAQRTALQHRQRQEERDAARRYAQQVIGDTLAELGYDVEPGFATLFVEGGVAHIQQPDWGDYYVRLRVKPEAGDLNLNVVRVSEDRATASNEQARRDQEMEAAWCAAHQELLQRLEEQGIASQPLRAHAPGELPVPCVQPDAVQRPSRVQRRQTAGRWRQRER